MENNACIDILFRLQEELTKLVNSHVYRCETHVHRKFGEFIPIFSFYQIKINLIKRSNANRINICIIFE